MKTKKPRKPKTLATLTNDAAVLLQLLVRIKSADENGIVECVTCGVKRHYKDDMAGGHFIERGRLATKLIENNINCQCFHCNAFGMKRVTVVLKYRNYMVNKHGEEYVTWLEQESRKIKKYTRDDLQEMIVNLKEEISKYNL